MKSSLRAIDAVIGTVACLATRLALEFGGSGNRADPVLSDALALLLFAPAGVIAPQHNSPNGVNEV